MAVNFFHEQWMGKTLPLNHFRIKAVKEGIKRAHVEGGTQQRMRRPLSWEMLKEMEEAAKEWGMGGRVVWIGLALTYLLLLRASELFAEDDGSVHAVYCLRGGEWHSMRESGRWKEGAARGSTRWRYVSEDRRVTKVGEGRFW